MSRITAFGEASVLVEVEDAHVAQRLRATLLETPVAGVTALVPGLRSLLVEFDPDAVDHDDLQRRLSDTTTSDGRSGSQRTRRIPVVYGGEHGRDLDGVAGLVEMAVSDFVDAHSALVHHVLFCGFAPGFAYLGGLPPHWEVPRLATPRTRTPRGAVAVADGMTGIYPAEAPGGWRIIGGTPITLFDPHRDPPTYLRPGDRVTFEPISPAAWAEYAGLPSDW